MLNLDKIFLPLDLKNEPYPHGLKSPGARKNVVPASSGSAVPYHFVASLVEPFFIQSRTHSWDTNLRKTLKFRGGMMSPRYT